jgi:antitoxin (DNA-binding transcriptional repressor) of toxin-antitoxin stability system
VNSAVTIEEASRDFPALLKAVSESRCETVILKDGKGIAKIIPFPEDVTDEEKLKAYDDFHASWLRETSEAEREAFARDIESGRTMVIQDIPNRWD